MKNNDSKKDRPAEREDVTLSARTAREVMNPVVLSVNAEWPIEQLAEFLVEHSISGAPVVSDEGELLGVVSLTDIVRQDTLKSRETQMYAHDCYIYDLAYNFAEEEISVFRVKEASEILVRDIMTTVVFSVDEDCSLRTVADMMVRGRIHRVFATRNGQLSGIITSLDILKLLRDM
ncbi:MAG: CBS domain-containing protein [Calditrichaeota bacterium]|nr:CBS domain-containing protein [Calditrichota bacterium]MCB0305856.1 CBS domain-containing protein [Calditrichota bacterium]MCB0316252.1 CBS domain-containing protein [Calditrichota bacterium]MCB9088224.1 CBS domain-containing protein [Calditrichia bacterium]